jgi:hypothetical protein
MSSYARGYPESAGEDYLENEENATKSRASLPFQDVCLSLLGGRIQRKLQLEVFVRDALRLA